MPLLNGSSVSSVVLRVPSGNTISESPRSSAVGHLPDRVLRARLGIAVDQHGAEHVLGDVAAQLCRFSQ